MSLKSGGLVPKLLFIGSLLLLFVWVVPKMLDYYQNIKRYDNKKSELEESYRKYNVVNKAQKFNLEAFKTETESLFSDISIEPQAEHQYAVTLQVEKNEIERINTFIESLSLHYLVKVKNSELNFEEKNQVIEVQFILEEL